MMIAREADCKSGNDYSNEFLSVRRLINDETNGGYQGFIKNLRPRYSRVWTDIAMGYFGLFMGVFALCMVSNIGIVPHVAATLVCAIWIGFWMAYLQLFIHEAAHYNIYSTRRGNDILCNLFLSSWTAAYIKAYRQIHFDHHRHLGTPEDTENSYFNALSLRFMVNMLTGMHAVRILKNRSNMEKTKSTVRKSLLGKLPLGLSLLLHGALIITLLIFHQFYVAIAWIIGMGVFFPFFAGLRQILEHRDEMADATIDFRIVPHGSVTRLFSGGWFAKVFGGAGFNRHLLHHWEPQISYTCLGDLEKFLMETRAGPILDSRRTTYFSTLKRLVLGFHDAV